MYNMNRFFEYLCFISFLLVLGCKSEKSVDYVNSPTYTENGINAIIEIPAGTNHKIEFNYDTGQFENDQKNGKDRVIDFLPYPGNYGYIPSTYMDPEKGGDGDALDVLVIGESVTTGKMIDVIPIATLQLLDGGEIDNKIIAVPTDSSLQVIQATDFQTFAVKYSMAQNIIQNWFLNYKGVGEMELVGWRDETFTDLDIKKWAK